MLSLDAFSELEVCQNVFAAGDPPWTLLGELTYYYTNSEQWRRYTRTF